MSEGSEVDSSNVEARITGEFMRRLQESEVDFELVDGIEGVLDEDDFGGEETLIELVETELLTDEA